MRRPIEWRHSSEHASDEQMLGLLDGEVSSREAARIEAHIARCWTCRARLETFKSAVTAFMNCRTAVMRSEIPEPPYEWGGFKSRLLREAARAEESAAGGFPTAMRYAAAVAVTLAVGLAGWATPTGSALAHRLMDALFPAPKAAPARAGIVPSASRPQPMPVAAIPRALAPRRTAPVPLAPVLPPVDLDAAEVEAHYAIHRTGLCETGMVQVVRSGGGVIVRGPVETEAERERLRAALLGSPQVHVEVRTFAEEVRALPESPAGDAPARVERVRNSRRAGADVLAPWLRPGAAGGLLEFSRTSVAMAAEGLRHAWALRRLAEAFPPDRAARLEPASRRLLVVIALDHSARWREALERFRRSMGQVLEAGAPAASPAPAGIPDLFGRAGEFDRLIRNLFADSDVPPDPQRDMPAMLNAVAALEAGLTDPDLAVRAFAAPHQAAQR